MHGPGLWLKRRTSSDKLGKSSKKEMLCITLFRFPGHRGAPPRPRKISALRRELAELHLRRELAELQARQLQANGLYAVDNVLCAVSGPMRPHFDTKGKGQLHEYRRPCRAMERHRVAALMPARVESVCATHSMRAWDVFLDACNHYIGRATLRVTLLSSASAPPATE